MDNQQIGGGVGVILLKNGKILLGKRNDDPAKADSELHGEGTWTLPGGKIEYGESFEECAKREVSEETGIIVKNTKVFCVNNDKNKYAHFISIGLISEHFEGEPKIMEPDEIIEWKWFELNKLPIPMFFPSAKIIKCFTEKSFYEKE